MPDFEMLEFDALRDLLNNKALNAARVIGLRVKIANQPGWSDPKDETWADFWYKTGGSKLVECGGAGALEMTVGILQFTISSPEKIGDGAAIRAGDKLRKLFSRQKWLIPAAHGWITIDVMTPKTTGKPVQGWYQVVADVSFRFYHRDRSVTLDTI